MGEHSLKSKNGVNIYVYKNPTVHGFYISLFVRSGSMYEGSEEQGITHFLEHSLIRNVNRVYGGKLYSALDRLGLEFNASTYSEMVQFYISGAVEHFASGAEIITKIFEPILLDKSEIDAERRRVKAEIREGDEKTSLAYFTAGKVFEGTPLCASILGTAKTVNAINGTTLEAYRKRIFSRENVFFYVTGNVSEGDISYLCDMIDRYTLTGTVCNENIAPVPANFLQRDGAVHIKNADYTMLRFTFDMDMSRISMAESDLLYDMLLSGYNSRLFIEMSELRGMIYDIGGSCERYRNIGTLSFYFEVKGKDIYSAVELVTDILGSLKREENVSPVKAGHVDNAYLLYDDIRELNFTFAYDNHVMCQSYASVEERRARYAGVTNARLAELAREIFTPRGLTLTAKGQKKSIDEEKIKSIIRRLS
ncbi:MAG: insulinase family protein [Clostridia bacterium]|nr:insulinase family protein [Clostridia bacterium]